MRGGQQPMNELIKISTHEQLGFVVDAKDFYNRNDIMSNGRKLQDFLLKFNFAKKLAMLCRTDKGEEVRDSKR